MRKLIAAALIGAGLGLATAGAGVAADMPLKARPAAAPGYNWTGWYVGGNLGYGWGRDTGALWDGVSDPDGLGFPQSFGIGGNVLPGVKPSGIIGGAQVGYNWQVSRSWVVGAVADLQASDMHATANNTVTPGIFATTIQSNNARIDWFGTVRGRAGYASDNWLFYATGGLAYGGVKSDLGFRCVNCVPPGIWAGSTSATNVGWAAGVGVEVGLTRNWTVGMEYLHFDLGTVSATAVLVNNAAGFGRVTFTAGSAFAGDIVRGSVNYRF